MTRISVLVILFCVTIISCVMLETGCTNILEELPVPSGWKNSPSSRVPTSNPALELIAVGLFILVSLVCCCCCKMSHQDSRGVRIPPPSVATITEINERTRTNQDMANANVNILIPYRPPVAPCGKLKSGFGCPKPSCVFGTGTTAPKRMTWRNYKDKDNEVYGHADRA